LFLRDVRLMKQIISISRRTDIPAHYLDWLIECAADGQVCVANPHNRAQQRTVPLRSEEVHTLVFWSKNYRPLLDNIQALGRYPNQFFHFTVNDCPELEPRIPALSERLEQARELVAMFGPKRVAWRFDPLVFWNGGRDSNIKSFERIAEFMAGLGVRQCVFSFVQWYDKCVRRAKKCGFDYYDPPLHQKLEIAGKLAQIAKRFDIVMQSCCCDELTVLDNVEKAHCIDGRLLSELAGEPCGVGHDTSQRSACGCSKSVDIGSYNEQPCLHGCFYCYANPIEWDRGAPGTGH